MRRNPAIVRVERWGQWYSWPHLATVYVGQSLPLWGDPGEVRKLGGRRDWGELHDVRRLSVAREIAARDRARRAFARKGALPVRG